MKKILLFFVLALLNFNVALSQGNSCATATPFCGNACFPNNTATVAPGGPAYGCLGTQPNPAWFFIRTTAAGTMVFNIDQNTTGCNSGSGIDVDFICWGPFANMTSACANLTGSCTGDHACSGNIEDCSYNPAAVETMTIVSPGAGNYYVVLITNYSDVAGYIDFNQTSGPATDCSILCPTVTAGNGFLQTNGTNMPASVACNSANLQLIASNNTPFGNPITPAIIISFTNNDNVNNSVTWYENGTFILCSGPAPCTLPLTINTNTDLQYSTMSPSATNLITLCEPNTVSVNIGPYTIIDAASGATIASGTWNDDGVCTNISFPPGTITGVSSWSVSPACPGCLVSTTDWGYTQFSPAVAGAGVWNICYSFDPPGTCPTYTYCQSITVTDPYSGAWTTPAPMCASAGSINLNTLVTGTAGGTWSGTGVSGSTFNPSGLNGTYSITYTVGPSPLGCGDIVSHNITVNPTPALTINNLAPTICSGSSTNITLSSSVGGTTYSWTAPTMTAGVAGGSAGTGASIAQILTATASGTATYTVTATAAGCSSTGTVVVTVNPAPTVVAEANQSYCAGATVPLNSFASTPAGATFTWTNSNTGIGLGASGSGSVPSFTATNGTGAAISGTITITPTLAGCVGPTSSYTITINPTPTVVAEANQSYCAGATVPLNGFVSSPVGATFTWTNSNTGIGLGASGSGSVPSFTATNGTGAAISGTITITPTLGGCAGPTSTYTITVNPSPTVVAEANQTYCAGDVVPLNGLASTPAGATFTWTNSNTAIGLGASGSGNIPSFVATGSGISGTITITPTLGGCTGPISTYTITVNSSPTVVAEANQTYCAGAAVPLNAFSSTPAGATFTWTNTNTGIGLGASGAGSVPAFTATNGTGAPISGTITITPTIGTCVGPTSSYTITINPTPTVVAEANQTYCAGATVPLNGLASTPAGATFTWTNSNTAIGLAASGSGNIPTFTATNGGGAPISGTITITPTLGPCTGPTSTYTITVNPMDNAGFNYGGSTTFCQTGTNPTATITGLPGGTFTSTPAGLSINASTGAINLAASALGSYNVTYSTTGPCPNTSVLVVTITTAPNSTIAYAGPYCQFGPNPSPTYPSGGSAGTFTSSPAGLVFVSATTGQINLTTSTPGTYTITNTIAAGGGCAASVSNANVTINPTPALVAEANQTYCAGAAVPINTFASTPAGATFTWTNSNTGIGLAASGSGSTPAFTATNATTGPITATITVTPTIGTCVGAASTFTITVNPTPNVVATPPSATICSGSATSIGLTGAVTGTTFAWTIGTITGGVTGASAGSGTTIAQVLNTGGATAGSVQYIITPTANGCAGTPVTVTITVNPVPFATATPSPSSICSGATTGITLSSFTAGTTFTWTVPGYTGSVTGGSAGSGTSIAQVLTNSGTTSGTATYTITPTAAGCVGSPITTVVTVFPVPNVTPTPTSQAICSGSTTAISLSGTVAGTTYSWPAPTISPVGAITGGFGASGVGIGQTLTNSTATAATATYIITPIANGCPGTPVSVVITVNPNPVISAIPAPAAICSGATSNIPLTSNVAGTTFSWTLGTVTGVSGALPGSGTNIAQVLTTTGVTSGTVTYNITATTAAGCTATTSATITVNPVPVATATPSSLTMCSGGTTAINLTSTVAGTTYVWGPTAVSGITGASAGSGSSIAQTLTATGAIAGTLTYTITPSAGTCPGTPISVNVTVNPTPVITATPTSQTFCDGGTTGITLSSNVSGTTISWTVVESGVTGATAGSGVTIADLLNTTGASPGTATYTVTGSASGCPGNTVNVTVTVNPIDNAAFTYGSSTYCQTGPDPSAIITGLPGGVFSVSPAGLVLLNPATGLLDLSASIPGTYTITYQTSGACPNNSSINIDITNAPTAGFTYPTPVCSSDPNPLPTFSGGSSAGTFTSSAGIVFVNVNTGEIDLAGSTAGTYTVYNAIAAAGGCAAALDSAMITINMAATVTAGADNTICEAGTYTLAGSIGGSATVGTWTTSGSGGFSSFTDPFAVYTPSAADVTAGSVTLTFTTDDPSGVCGVVVDSMVLTITPLDNAGFTYGAGTTFCASGINPVPTITGLPGGTFSSSPAGLVFVSTATGEINLSGSVLGTYDVYYTTAGVCPNSDTISVTITTAPSATFTWTTGGSAFCQTAADPGPVFGGGASGGIFTATPAGIVIDGVTGIVDLSASAVGTYMITNTIVAAGGCATSVDSLAITIDPAPIAEAGNNMTICAGSTATMANDSIGGSATTLTWTSSGTGTWTGATTLAAVYTPSAADIAAGTVTLYMTTDDPAGACGAVVDSITLTIDPTPPAPAVSNTAISLCSGNAVGPITATGTGGTFTWYSDGALTTVVSTSNPFNPGILPTGTTSYWVTETIGACQGPATQIDITVNPLPVVDTTAAVVTPADCGAPTGSVTGITMTSGASPFTYQWQDGFGLPAGSLADLTGAAPGVYTLTITDANGCSIIAGPFTITSTAGVVASFTANPTTGETPLTVNLTNSSTGASSYVWYFGPYANNDTSTAVNPTYIITPLGLFDICLVAINSAGCMDTACVSIDVYINSVFVIPNVFTPNDDGTNDVFTVDAVGLESMDAEIYNRWGQKEYEWHTTNGGWDGRTASGVPAPDGTYYFIMKAKGIDGKEYKEHGSFSLIR